MGYEIKGLFIRSPKIIIGQKPNKKHNNAAKNDGQDSGGAQQTTQNTQNTLSLPYLFACDLSKKNRRK